MQVILNQLNMHDALANSLLKGTTRRTTQRSMGGMHIVWSGARLHKLILLTLSNRKMSGLLITHKVSI